MLHIKKQWETMSSFFSHQGQQVGHPQKELKHKMRVHAHPTKVPTLLTVYVLQSTKEKQSFGPVL